MPNDPQCATGPDAGAPTPSSSNTADPGATPPETLRRSRGAGTTSSRVDGRQRAKLERALRRMLAGETSPQVPVALWVAGPPGCGRATLLREIRQKKESEGICWVRGSAYPGTGEILEPILRAVRTTIGEIRALAAGGHARWVTLWDQIRRDRAPALTRVLPEEDWGGAVEPFPTLEPGLERSRLLDHLGGILLDFAERAPLVVQIDGCEHLDCLSRDTLRTLQRVLRIRRQARVAGLPLAAPPPLALVLVSGELSEPPIDGPEGEVLGVPIRGLDRREFIQFLEREYGAEQPAATTEKLFQLTRGNRFDLERRVAWENAERGGGDPHDRVRRLLDYGSFDAEVVRRVRRLGARGSLALQALAVLGKPVSLSILERICGLSREESAAVTAELTTGDWVRCSDGRVIRLHHERLRRPILDTIGESELCHLHQRIAESIEAEHEGRENRRFQEVHHHRARGRQDLAALEAAFLGAEEAVRLHDFEGAIAIHREMLPLFVAAEPAQVARGLDTFTRVLRESRTPDEALLEHLERILERREGGLERTVRAQLWRQLGQAAGAWAMEARELESYQRAFRSLGSEERCQERVMVYACLARAFLQRRRFDETMRYCQEGFDLLSYAELKSDPEFLELSHVTEQVHSHRGEFGEAIELQTRCLRMALVEGSPSRQVECLLRLARLHDRRGEPEAARSRLLEAVPIARGSGSRLLQAGVLERIGQLHADHEEWEAAIAAFELAFTIQSEIGDEDRTLRLLGSIGLCSLAVGRLDDGAHNFRLYALAHAERPREEIPPPLPGFPLEYRSRSERDEEIHRLTAEVERACTSPDRRSSAYQALGDLHRDRGGVEESRRCLTLGLRAALDHGLDPSPFHLRFGRTHRASGNVARALASLQSGLDAMAGDPRPDHLAGTLVQVGLLHQDRGDTASGLSYLLRGLSAYLDLEHEPGVAHTLVELSGLLLSLGREQEAEGLARAATTICATLDLTRLEGEAWLVFGRCRAARADGLEQLRAAEEIFRRLGVPGARAEQLLAEAELRERTGDIQGARTRCQEAMEISRDLGLELLLARCLLLRGRLEGVHLGRFLNATRSCEAALDHAGRVGAKGILAGVHRLQADLYGRRGSRAVAEEHAARADALEAALRSRSPQFPDRDPHPSGESDTLTRSTTEGVV
ncbi:MAG: AAA family ATPase [Planctomycetota bacterium]